EAVDPIETATLRSATLAQEVINELLQLDVLTESVLRKLNERLRAAQEPWRRLSDVMKLVRAVGRDWVHEPPTIGEALKKVEELSKLLDGIGLLERSDLRSQRQQFDRSYTLAFARYREVKAASNARAFLTRVDPLTRLDFSERQFWT